MGIQVSSPPCAGLRGLLESAGLAICAALLAQFMIGCERGAPEIIAGPHLASVQTGTTPTGIAYKIGREYFIVANPPVDQWQIRHLIEGYLDAHAGKSADASLTVVIQSFYKETAFTPRDFKESNRGYFSHDRIDDHARDILVEVKSNPAAGTREFRFYRPEELP